LQWLKKLSILIFESVIIEIDCKISPEVFGGAAVHDFFKRLSFISFPGSHFSCRSRCTAEPNFPLSPYIPPCLQHRTLLLPPSASLDQPANISHYTVSAVN
jgi:hypothetical protein